MLNKALTVPEKKDYNEVAKLISKLSKEDKSFLLGVIFGRQSKAS